MSVYRVSVIQGLGMRINVSLQSFSDQGLGMRINVSLQSFSDSGFRDEDKCQSTEFQ